ncbi:MAG: hypothetical protein OCD76_07425 [Reichenbachiella sp.]
MFKSLQIWLYAAGAAAVAIFYAVFTSTRKENKLLKQVNKTQSESLRVVEVSDKVSNTIHKEHIIEEASIKASIEATKEKVKNETVTNDDLLDPEFIKLLNDSRD